VLINAEAQFVPKSQNAFYKFWWNEELSILKLEMWANAQRDGRPAEYRWRPLFNAAKFG